jgi:hypothetical protein
MKKYVLVPQEDIDALKDAMEDLDYSYSEYEDIINPMRKLIETEYRTAIDLAEPDKSFARFRAYTVWPKLTLGSAGTSMSQHKTKAEAKAACEFTRKSGWNHEGVTFYPVYTYVHDIKADERLHEWRRKV